MRLFSSRPAPPVHDFTQGPVVKQSNLACDVPDVVTMAAQAIEAACRQTADLTKVLGAIERVLAGQMDAYAIGLPGFDDAAVRDMRDALYRRPDFDFTMLFDGLTYFGPTGVAMANALAERLEVFRPQLAELIGEGHFDRES